MGELIPSAIKKNGAIGGPPANLTFYVRFAGGLNGLNEVG